jgi:hypothetical protein
MENRPTPEQIQAWRPKGFPQSNPPRWLDLLRKYGAVSRDNLERALVWARDDKERAELSAALARLTDS